MSAAPAKRRPAPTAALIALLVSGVLALSFLLLAREVDDAVGSGLTIVFGLAASLIAGALVFFFAWIALRQRESRAVCLLFWLLAGLVVAGSARVAIGTELDRRDYAAARDPESSPERLRALDTRDDIIKHRLASNPATPPDVLAELPESLVRDRLPGDPGAEDEAGAEPNAPEER